MSDSRIACLTGGSRRLGHCTAHSLARKGVGFVIPDREHREEPEQVCAETEEVGLRNAALLPDVSEKEAIYQ